MHQSAVLIGLICLCLPAVAQQSAGTAPAPEATDAGLVRQLLERIDRLEKRVAELESTKPAPASPQAITATAPAQPAPAATMPGMSHELPAHVDGGSGRPTMDITGFSDTNFVASDEKGSRSGFNEGQFVLHVSSVLSSKVTFFGEMSFIARPDAGTGVPAAPGFNVEIERSIIRYDYNDALKLSFGRYHTPINYWNTTFHHGSWLQTTASRPEMAQFGGRFIPVHFVGALVEGTTPAGGLNLTYNAGVGNGRGDVINRNGDAGDSNNNRAWLLNAFVRPDSVYGLQVGGSVYRDRITAIGLPGVGEWIETFHVVREKENPEFIAEFANIRHRTTGGAVSNSQAWYAQIAYRVAPKLKPYYRYEHIHIPRSEVIFSQLMGVKGSTVGVRYDLSQFAALKFEYRSIQRPDRQRVNVSFMQTSFTF